VLGSSLKISLPPYNVSGMLISFGLNSIYHWAISHVSHLIVDHCYDLALYFTLVLSTSASSAGYEAEILVLSEVEIKEKNIISNFFSCVKKSMQKRTLIMRLLLIFNHHQRKA
jgi:hypothetical protein